MHTLLVSATELQALYAGGAPLMVFDCTSDLMNPAQGPQQYLEAHLPGAVFADLNQNLSDKTSADAASGGRHPLPSREKFAAWLASIGFSNAHQAVVYDRNGANYCGRLWWMLKWVGHDAVAVLDGGLQAWQAAQGTVETSAPAAQPQGSFTLGPALRTLATTADVQAHLAAGSATIVDARAAPRYRGEVEPMDPVAGHIPGALNRPFNTNIAADGRFKTGTELRQEFDTLLGTSVKGTVVHHCGSGVSAVPNLIAMELAGLPPAVLYAGSWSEWCSDPSRPMFTPTR